MLEKKWHQNRPYRGRACEGALALERNGHYLLRGALAGPEVERLREDILEVYRRVPPDLRANRSMEEAEMFRYEMFNHSSLCQATIARRRTLDVIEPLLGGDCHVISCTAWKNPPGNTVGAKGLQWHVDGGPYVPRRRGILWSWLIPYPVFVVATQPNLKWCLGTRTQKPSPRLRSAIAGHPE